MADKQLILINKRQNLSINEIEENLIWISKLYREGLYLKGDFQNSIDKNGYYIFLVSEQEDGLYDDDDETSSISECCRDLKANGISAFKTDEKEFKDLFPDSTEFDDPIPITFDFENNVFEADIAQNLLLKIADYFNDDFSSYLDNIFSQIENGKENDLFELEKISQKIIYELIKKNRDISRSDILSVLISIFDSRELDMSNTYVLFLIVKFLHTADEEIFVNHGDYLEFCGRGKIFYFDKLLIFSKINKKKCKGTWWITIVNEQNLDFPILSCFSHFQDYVTKVLSNLFEIRIPIEWDWVSFEEFVHFINFGIESDLEMPEFIDYYKILGVKYDCPADKISYAYKNKMKQHHPDITKTNNNLEKVKLLNEAYQVLKNSKKRREYDKQYKSVNFI